MISFFNPRWVRQAPKTGPRPVQDGPKSYDFPSWIFASILHHFGLRFGSILGPFWPPKSTPNPRQKSMKIKLRQHTSTRPFQEAPRAPQEASRSPQEAPKTLPDSLKGSKSPSGGSPRSPQDPPNSHLFQVCSKITALT